MILAKQNPPLFEESIVPSYSKRGIKRKYGILSKVRQVKKYKSMIYCPISSPFKQHSVHIKQHSVHISNNTLCLCKKEKQNAYIHHVCRLESSVGESHAANNKSLSKQIHGKNIALKCAELSILLFDYIH